VVIYYREKFQVGSNQSVDPSSRRTLLLQKFDLCKGEIEQLKEENIKLGLEVLHNSRFIKFLVF